MNPVAISQRKPGNLVSGIRKRAFGQIRLIQLASPHAARRRPNPTSHFGKSFMNPAVTETPAMSSPRGTE